MLVRLALSALIGDTYFASPASAELGSVAQTALALLGALTSAPLNIVATASFSIEQVFANFFDWRAIIDMSLFGLASASEQPMSVFNHKLGVVHGAILALPLYAAALAAIFFAALKLGEASLRATCRRFTQAQEIRDLVESLTSLEPRALVRASRGFADGAKSYIAAAYVIVHSQLKRKNFVSGLFSARLGLAYRTIRAATRLSGRPADLLRKGTASVWVKARLLVDRLSSSKSSGNYALLAGVAAFALAAVLAVLILSL